MYSRKTGTVYNTQAQQKIDNFNNNLREQYRQHSSPVNSSTPVTESQLSSKSSSSLPERLTALLGGDEIIIIALILLLLFEENKDYLIIGVLAALLFVKR